MQENVEVWMKIWANFNCNIIDTLNSWHDEVDPVNVECPFIWRTLWQELYILSGLQEEPKGQTLWNFMDARILFSYGVELHSSTYSTKVLHFCLREDW